jgi:hypothetical protein
MASALILQLRAQQALVAAGLGESYFVFIAPAHPQTFAKQQIFERYVRWKLQPPDALLLRKKNLELYVVDLVQLNGWQLGDPHPEIRPVLRDMLPTP